MVALQADSTRNVAALLGGKKTLKRAITERGDMRDALREGLPFSALEAFAQLGAARVHELADVADAVDDLLRAHALQLRLQLVNGGRSRSSEKRGQRGRHAVDDAPVGAVAGGGAAEFIGSDRTSCPRRDTREEKARSTNPRRLHWASRGMGLFPGLFRLVLRGER